jgi:GH3 auxin-responsive promoter
MKLKSLLAKPFANYIYKQIKKGIGTAVEDQEKIFASIVKSASKTLFGTNHSFAEIKTHEDYCRLVPIRDYEAFKPYIEKIKEGKHNILWKGQPIYFAKTSGTTSGVKYIPITKDSIHNHINTARNALLCYIICRRENDFS